MPVYIGQFNDVIPPQRFVLMNVEFTFPEFECVVYESSYTGKFDGGILIVVMSDVTHLHSYASSSSPPSSPAPLTKL